MDERRFERIEIRVDEIKEDVGLLKAESRFNNEAIKELRGDIKKYTLEVKSHVAGDNKIITEIAPLIEVLPSIKDIVAEKMYKDRLKKERTDKLKRISIKVGIWGTVIGTIAGIARLFL